MLKQRVVTVALTFILTSLVSLRAAEITLLTWPDYISQSVLDEFYRQSNIQVKQVYYDSDDARDKLLNLSRGHGYDVILTSRVRLPMYIQLGWLETYQQSKLPNIQHLSPKWHEAANEFGQYCIPYFWGTIGILYNKKYISSPPTSWRVFFNQLPQYSGKVNLLNDSRTLLPMALIAAGFNSHSNQQQEINQAATLIHKHLAHINSFSALSLEQENRLNNEQIWISMAYNGDALYLKSLNPDLEFIQPTDGTNAWLDCLTISKASRHKNSVHQFINFLLLPKNALELAQQLQYPTPNLTAYKQLPLSIRQNHTLYPKLSKNVQLNQVIAPSTERYFQITYKQLVFAHKQLAQDKP
ncbi:Spermidine/putrescine-binding periplasmic protein [Catenovulum agarivorans DS-2]|uniref:Spermidine/putrescine-binding periplasmic protein n=1 Tax=Catenovulum agarivorans DS-2 TaxID=1328313 RepID=W7QPW0_9ALTE|nr:spermidine/putrescine ABC transporter substrate-binding protein [Catenovulum agarivorans]EWH11022.1 Spermidine/putrescine-binding periplasmic protein [Catenovulum agarivorans DS-2]